MKKTEHAIGRPSLATPSNPSSVLAARVLAYRCRAMMDTVLNSGPLTKRRLSRPDRQTGTNSFSWDLRPSCRLCDCPSLISSRRARPTSTRSNTSWRNLSTSEVSSTRSCPSPDLKNWSTYSRPRSRRRKAASLSSPTNKWWGAVASLFASWKHTAPSHPQYGYPIRTTGTWANKLFDVFGNMGDDSVTVVPSRATRRPSKGFYGTYLINAPRRRTVAPAGIRNPRRSPTREGHDAPGLRR